MKYKPIAFSFDDNGVEVEMLHLIAKSQPNARIETDSDGTGIKSIDVKILAILFPDLDEPVLVYNRLSYDGIAFSGRCTLPLSCIRSIRILWDHGVKL